jgi:glycosyltransferase involved in cell wall biosynthesis
MPDHIIAASPETACRLEEIVKGHVPITVAPNGIDLTEVKNTYPDTAPTDLVVVGRLMAHKRVDMLLDVVARLHADGSPVTCRVIGDGPEREALHEKAEALGISHAVDFRHNINEQKDVYSLVKAAKIAVFPSSREGFGIAVLEALACGIPVITTSAPDNLAQNLVARSPRSVICDPCAPSIVAVVKEMFGRADSSENGGFVVDSWLTEYSWDAMAEQVANALGI